ncbi:MAG: hypothetical protein RR844_01730 [Clostridium sp.]
MRRINLKFDNKVAKVVAIAVAVLVLFFISYSIFSIFSPTKEQMYLNDLMDNINDVNNKSKEFLDDSKINSEKALKTLPKMREALYKIALDAGSSKYANEPKYASSYSNLSKGLNENILLLDQLSAMISNPYGKDIELAGENLKIYRDTSENYYNLVEYKNSTFSLGNSMKGMINETLDYCISSNNAKKIEEIKTAEAERFLSKLNELKISMDKLMINYYEKVMDCRTNKMTYELLISKLDDTISKMDSVKSVLSQMSIPNEFLPLYNNFSEVVNLYSKYLFDVKYAIVTESVRRDKTDITEDFMDSLYDSSNKTYEDVQKKYKNFTKEYNKIKGNN